MAITAMIASTWTFAIARSMAREAGSVLVSHSVPAAVVLHEPIIAEVTVQNNTLETVGFDLGHDATRNFVVRVTRPDGVVVTADRFPVVREGVYALGKRTVAPLSSYMQPLLLNQWYAFEEPGTYSVDIELATRTENESGLNVQVEHKGPVTLRVGPRDEAVLREVCGEMLWRIRGTSVVAERYAAASRLSYVNDEVALPYIKQVLDETDSVDHLLFAGLVRFGTVEARALLVEMSRSQNEDRVSYATAALIDFAEKRRF